MDSPGNQLGQAHERLRKQGGRVQVVPWGREKEAHSTRRFSLTLFFRAEKVLSIRDSSGRTEAGHTRWELIMGILDSPRVKGIVR